MDRQFWIDRIARCKSALNVLIFNRRRKAEANNKQRIEKMRSRLWFAEDALKTY